MVCQPIPLPERSQPIFLPFLLGRVVGTLFRIPVFRIAQNDVTSRILIWAYNFFTRCFSPSRTCRAFDEEIARAALNRFQALGASVENIRPKDGQGEVAVMSFKARDFQQKIEECKGSWEKIEIDGNQVFAIIPPKELSNEWDQFVENIKNFGWKSAEYNGQQVIVTCEFADIVSEEKTQCFLSVHSTSQPFVKFKSEMAYYLGMKQDFYFFDNGNTWLNSGRNCTEQRFYLEIESVYEELIQNNYDPKNIWVGGFCGGAPVAAYLKKQHPELNFFASQSFCDLDDFNSIPFPRRWMASILKGSIFAQEDSSLTAEGTPAYAFSVEKMWENSSKSEDSGKVMIVHVEGDEEISEDASRRYTRLAEKVSNFVRTVFVPSTSEGWKHIDYFYNYEISRRHFAEVVFQ